MGKDFWDRLWPFNHDPKPPAPEPTQPTPVPVEPAPPPIDPHQPPIPEPGDPPPPLPPIPHPTPPGETFAADLFVNGEEIVFFKDNLGKVWAHKLVVRGGPGSRLTLRLVVDMEYVGDAALLAQLRDTQAFRDYAFIPGAAVIHLASWPWRSDPRFQMGDPKIVGTVVESGALGGWGRTQNNTAAIKDIYLANITEYDVRFEITIPLVVAQHGDDTYALIKGFIDAAYGDDRKRHFEIWLNNVEADF